jgi:hypothetical protein
MRLSKITRLLCAAGFTAAVAGVPQLSQAATLLSGCSGGAFGADCSLAELLAGGSIQVGATQFSNFALSLFSGRAIYASLIRVDPIEASMTAGLRLVDTGNTLRAQNGDATQNDFGFNVSVIGGPGITSTSLNMSVGDLSGAGSFSDVFDIALSSNLVNVLGANNIICDPSVSPSCANTSLTDVAQFARTTGLAITGGFDVVADTVGVAEINSITYQFSLVPEPASMALVLLGFAGLGVVRQRK